MISVEVPTILAGKHWLHSYLDGFSDPRIFFAWYRIWLEAYISLILKHYLLSKFEADVTQYVSSISIPLFNVHQFELYVWLQWKFKKAPTFT